MTEPTDDELNQAVAKANGLRAVVFQERIAFYVGENECVPFPNIGAALASDWRALMAAVAKLELNSRKSQLYQIDFERMLFHEKALWRVLSFNLEIPFEIGNPESEAHALALCIHAVVNKAPHDNGCETHNHLYKDEGVEMLLCTCWKRKALK